VIGFAKYSDDPVASLSHGQKQRLEIALATIAEPALVLLDEPTAGMSREEVAHTVDLVRDLTRQSTVIVVEHNMDFVRRIADKVTVMHEGRAFAEGRMAEIETHTGVRDIYLGRRGRNDASGH
jgi:urea transport system ATP-binding protein